MAALTGDRDTERRKGEVVNLGLAAATKIYAGSLVARDASGNAVPGSTATTLLGVGRARTQVDNSSGAANALTIDVEKGVHKFGNSTGADLIDNGDIGSSCYIVDDQTVALTNGGTTRSVAGTVFAVDSDGGVWVKFS
jgi:hypothetical protein